MIELPTRVSHMTPYFRISHLTATILATILATVFSPVSAEAEGPDFYREVRPILAKACFHCHGPDEETREADLRLDLPSGLFKSQDGHVIVKAGDVEHSELMKRILSSNPDDQMPPLDSGRSLTDAQKETLSKWIQSGAPWVEHWAFVAPVLPTVPNPNTTADADSLWNRREIDRFILQKQLASGLSHSPRAEPEILVRRVFLDLIGLPPTMEEAQQWVTRLKLAETDLTSDAVWQELTDHLLGRPEYGERWARVWLDLARYADTNGYEKDRPRSIWPYRDWVVNALNQDMPFDQFTVEQLAGDMLPDATVSQKVASGFHRNSMLNEEGGIDPLEFRFHAMTDRVAVTGTTWLGLTTGCAQCHTHKYDPITHTEYYSFMAFLNNADEPTLALPNPDQNAAIERQKAEAALLLDELATKWPVPSSQPLAVKITHAAGSAGEDVVVTPPNTVTITGTLPQSSTYTVELAMGENRLFDLVNLETFRAEGQTGPGRAANGNFVLSEIQFSLVTTGIASEGSATESEVSLPVSSVTASVEQKNYSVQECVDGKPDTGWAIDGGSGIPPAATATFRFDQQKLSELWKQPGSEIAEARLRIRLIQNHGASHLIGAFRVSPGLNVSQEDARNQRTELVQQAFLRWLTEQQQSAVAWKAMRPSSATSNMPHLTILDDHSILATGDTTKQDHYEIRLASGDDSITAIRLEALPDERLPGNGPGTTYYEGSSGDFYLNELSVYAGDERIAVNSATESYTRNQFGSSPTSAALTLDEDVQTGWSVFGGEGQRHTAVYVLAKPVPPHTELKIQMTFGRHFASSLGRFRFSAADSHVIPVARRLSESEETLLLTPEPQLTADERRQLFHAFLLQAAELSAAADQIRQLLRAPSASTTLVMRERPPENPRVTHRHHRGEYLQPREEVTAVTPEALHPWPEEWSRNRLNFARWIVHRNNPLTARVLVNRQWAAFFGRGIVATVDDFGIQGSSPSHPELLDWLAVTWMDADRWSLKALHRRMVLSETYRQSSVRSDKSPAIDPGNELLSFAPRFRLDAEIVRDSIVQAAGVLSKQIGGPPVRPLQPPGITEVTFGSPGWAVSEGADRYRRSIYTFIKRTAPFAMVTTFDGPSGDACIARRNRSNTPLQALTLLNDPMFMDLAQVSGRRLAQLKVSSDQERIRVLFESLLSRQPAEVELAAIAEFISAQRRELQEGPAPQQATDSAALTKSAADMEQAVWAAVSRAMFALDEVVMRP